MHNRNKKEEGLRCLGGALFVCVRLKCGGIKKAGAGQRNKVEVSGNVNSPKTRKRKVYCRFLKKTTA